ncbi:hypothetical protein KIN20_012549 [Parelaphostrongylus tenuis]|uniref:Uncharacterized protein n=1 Tax=Parelaphostrongylus tenuis TaxID=148309 RepID=A0AAD5QN84_PARTN|nr:hypothetical protein KIN20_012549 [Parelaphostrongylus tenuis]
MPSGWYEQENTFFNRLFQEWQETSKKRQKSTLKAIYECIHQGFKKQSIEGVILFTSVGRRRLSTASALKSTIVLADNVPFLGARFCDRTRVVEKKPQTMTKPPKSAHAELLSRTKYSGANLEKTAIKILEDFRILESFYIKLTDLQLIPVNPMGKRCYNTDIVLTES